ncbi:deoxyribose-phosphate aldolase [Candidatus Bathyarchaeota archaeon]|nr:deoxyribose-phosphate aldolase [Candidatus Bathyarchaeota archaeon]RJS79773.1 MAG: deoxyribose-phosphate aldolase [Candidatus Bathyarchaeota archaeon]
MIDSTAVKPSVTRSDVEKLCRDALHYGFGAVCVNPVYVKFASQLLKGSEVKVCSTVGFPFGATLPEIKAFEALKVLEDGAQELDMVINLSALKSGDYDAVKNDIVSVVNVKRVDSNVIVKVIIETNLLTDEEKAVACKLAKEAGADFVKTSTGFFGKGATVEDVRLMRRTVGEKMGVKAAGGIRSYEDAVAMIEAGANRIGTSTAVQIIKGAP